MKIIRKTTVKQIVTDHSREKLASFFQTKIEQLKKEIEQLQFEKKKMIFQKRFDREKIDHRFAIEKKKREQNITWYEFQLEQLQQIPNGSEITEREVDEIIDVSIGTEWDKIAGDRSIIIKDGKVIEIK
ncbi:YlqD family protein [Bacillaceae bacterium W0354]